MPTATEGKRAVGSLDFRDREEEKKLKIGDGPSSESDSESEYDKFFRQQKESYGFDVDANPYDDDFMCYFAAFNDLNEVTPDQLKECNELAIEAVKFHNLNKKPKNANLEYVKLLKFCNEFIPVDYELYYLTLEAKDVIDGSVQTYQAKVLCDFSRENPNSTLECTPKVLMFKKKGDANFIGQDPKKRGFCHRHGIDPCGCEF